MSERRPGEGALFAEAGEEPVDEPAPDGAGQRSQFGLELIAVTVAIFLIVAASVGAWPLLPFHGGHAAAPGGPNARTTATPGSATGQPTPSAGGGVAILPSPSPGSAGTATPTPAPVANASPTPSAPPSGPAPVPTPAPPAPAAPQAAPPDCSASSSPAGTVTIGWSSNRAVVTFNVSGMLPNCSYAVGIYKDTCGSQASLLTGFPALTASSNGTDMETVSGYSSLSGIPAGSSLRVGPAGTTDPGSAENPVACANTPQDRTINSRDPSYFTHIH